MSIVKLKQVIKKEKYKFPWLLWGERLLSWIVCLNVILVFYDLTYVEMRNIYLRGIIHLKKAQKTPEQKYIEKVNLLYQLLQTEGVNSTKILSLLEDINRASFDLFIKNPPFRRFDRDSSIEQIKQKFIDKTREQDFKQALKIFWSQDYLINENWSKKLHFFYTQIQPLILSNEPILLYDIVKGIEPERESQKYLRTVEELKINLIIEGIDGKNIEPLLKKLRQQSASLIDNNYYGKNPHNLGNMTKIKYSIQEHIYGNSSTQINPYLTPTLRFLNNLHILNYLAPEILWTGKSSKQAFYKFWSKENLRNYGWQSELNFWENNLKFYFQSIYFRHLAIDGDFIDRFWLIDLPWIVFFWLEFLIRISLIMRREKLKFSAAVSQRWYDIFLLLPWFTYCRIITAFIRLHEVKFPSMERLLISLRLSFITSLIKELIQVLLLRMIQGLQDVVSDGYLKNHLFSSKPVDSAKGEITQSSEIQIITNKIMALAACKVLPEIHDDLEAFLEYNVEKSLQQLSLYRRIGKIPLLRRLPRQLARNLVVQIANSITINPQKSYQSNEITKPDLVGNQLKDKLIENFKSHLLTSLEEEKTLEQIETLLINWLESIKSNYIKSDYDSLD